MSTQDDFVKRGKTRTQQIVASSKVFSLLITLFIIGFLFILATYYTRTVSNQQGNVEGWQNRDGIPQNPPNAPPKPSDDVAAYNFRKTFDQNYQGQNTIRYTDASVDATPNTAQTPVTNVQYVVQAGAFSNPVQAEARLHQLQVAGYTKAYAVRSSGNLTRILLGPYENQNEARNVVNALEVLQIDSIIATQRP